jgi:hypothetical protein
VPIVSALEHNTWFTKVRAGHIRLSHEALDRILLVIRRSLSIEEIYLDNLGLRGSVSSLAYLGCINGDILADVSQKKKKIEWVNCDINSIGKVKKHFISEHCSNF